MIISGGENIYPAEVESCLYGHPAVAEVAVIGLPDARWGESPCAVIFPRAGAGVGLDDIIAHCRGKIARYKIPRSLIVTPEPLPRTPTGKVLKRVLRERYGQGG